MLNRSTLQNLLLPFFLLVVSSAYSQSVSDWSARSTLYLEGANKGAIYSLNYDRIFRTLDRFSLSYRAGLSFTESDIAIPLGIHLLTGSGSTHGEFSFTVIANMNKYRTLGLGWPKDSADTKIYISPGAGFRFQNPDGGLFVRASIAPTLLFDPAEPGYKNEYSFLVRGSLGLGFSF